MARKLFSQIIIVLASFLFLFGCASTPTQEPLVNEVEKLLEHEVLVGYIKIYQNTWIQKNRQNEILLLAQSPIGQKYLTMQQGTGHYSKKVDFGLTDYAISAGAFQEGPYFYIPIGSRRFEIVDQKTIEFPGGEYEAHTKFRVSLEGLNDFGQQAKATVSSVDQFRETFASVKEADVILYKNKNSPGWQTRN